LCGAFDVAIAGDVAALGGDVVPVFVVHFVLGLRGQRQTVKV